MFNAESTDKRSLMANSDYPTQLRRGKTTITTSTSSGSYVTGSETIDELSELDPVGSAGKLILRDTLMTIITPSGIAYPVPVATRDGSGNQDLTVYYSSSISNADPANPTTTFTVAVSKRGGGTSDIYQIYWVETTQDLTEFIT